MIMNACSRTTALDWKSSGLWICFRCAAICCPLSASPLPRVRKTAQILFGKNELTAVLNLEDSTAGLDQLGLDAEFFLQFLRQTGGPGFVVSHAAVRDLAGLHVFPNILANDSRSTGPHKEGPIMIGRSQVAAVLVACRVRPDYKADCMGNDKTRPALLFHCNQYMAP